MALLTLRDVTLGFGGPPLLDGVNLLVDPGERVCLVGRNGTGKTTLLKLISGDVQQDTGEISRTRDSRVGTLAQEVPSDLTGTCAEVVSGGLSPQQLASGDTSHLIDAVVSRLGLEGAAQVATLSGGMKRRVMLARALVMEPDLLLLDEPTNHLDIESIQWLEEFLARYERAFLFVTHDRVFMQKLANRIVDLDRGALTSYPGNYRTYLDRKEKDLDVEAGKNEKFDRKLAAEEVWIRQGVRERRTRNEGRVRALKKLREEARARRTKTGNVKIHAQGAGRTSRKVVKTGGVEFSYPGGGAIVSGLDTTVYRGDRLAVLGPNGCGKTTLLKLLLGELEPTGGTVEQGDNLEVAYLDQLRDQLDYDKTVIENVIDKGDKVIIDGKPRHIITYLKDFLFSADRARTPVWVLSGGERNRLLLAKLFTRPSNVLVLDEPTNDLDTETLELLEECLLDYSGTVLFVSHDRAFINNVATCTLVFERDGGVEEYVGGYDDWLRQRRADAPASTQPEDKPRRKKTRPEGPRKLTFKERLELEELPGRIEALEEEERGVHASLADPDLYSGGDGDRVIALKARMEELSSLLATTYQRWEELESIREAHENG